MSIAFLGAGNIARAIIGGLLQAGTSPDLILAADPSGACRARVAEMGIRALGSNREAAEGAETIVVCVKPDIVVEALSDLPPPHQGRLFVSVAAGVTTSTMIESLGAYPNVVRCMPNTPALVREGMTALFAAKDVAEAPRAVAEGILKTVGATVWVDDEADLDAVTAVSGSGPAYFFFLMEAMIQAAEAQGLSAQTARQLVMQTALGSARLVRETGTEPATLRRQVTSPGGTTEAAIRVLEDAGFGEALGRAIHAAGKRAIELSGG